MLKKSASIVLASFRPSTYGHGNRACLGRLGVDKNGDDSPLRHGRLTVSPASTNVALIMLRAVDLAAASLNGLFEPPAGLYALAQRCADHRVLGAVK